MGVIPGIDQDRHASPRAGAAPGSAGSDAPALRSHTRTTPSSNGANGHIGVSIGDPSGQARATPNPVSPPLGRGPVRPGSIRNNRNPSAGCARVGDPHLPSPLA